MQKNSSNNKINNHIFLAGAVPGPTNGQVGDRFTPQSFQIAQQNLSLLIITLTLNGIAHFPMEVAGRVGRKKNELIECESKQDCCLLGWID